MHGEGGSSGRCQGWAAPATASTALEALIYGETPMRSEIKEVLQTEHSFTSVRWAHWLIHR